MPTVTQDALAMTDAVPLMESDGTTGRNNARDFRTIVLKSLFGPHSVSGPYARPGVICSLFDAITDQHLDLKVIPQASPNSTVQAYPGRCVVNKTGHGPYLVSQETTVSSLPLPAADAQSRYDVVFVNPWDQNAGDPGGGPHGPWWGYVKGDASGAPSLSATVAAVPTDALPIAAILRPGGISNITSGNITDLRKSSALLGTIRPLLPGESPADDGVLVGERISFRTPSGLTALGAPEETVCRWGEDGEWHLTHEIRLNKPTQSGSGSLNAGAEATIASLVIPDPLVPYRIAAEGSCGWGVTNANQTGQLASIALTVDATAWNTNQITAGRSNNVSSSIAGASQTTLSAHEDVRTTVYTGSHTVRLIAANNSGTQSYTIPASSVETRLNVTLVPA